jgi:hypothetical protein
MSTKKTSGLGSLRRRLRGKLPKVLRNEGNQAFTNSRVVYKYLEIEDTIQFYEWFTILVTVLVCALMAYGFVAVQLNVELFTLFGYAKYSFEWFIIMFDCLRVLPPLLFAGMIPLQVLYSRLDVVSYLYQGIALVLVGFEIAKLLVGFWWWAFGVGFGTGTTKIFVIWWLLTIAWTAIFFLYGYIWDEYQRGIRRIARSVIERKAVLNAALPGITVKEKGIVKEEGPLKPLQNVFEETFQGLDEPYPPAYQKGAMKNKRFARAKNK